MTTNHLLPSNRPPTNRLGLPLIQAAFVLSTAIAVGGLLIAATTKRSPLAPPWLAVALVTLLGTVLAFVVRYWRIRPVPPGAISTYASTVLVRTSAALVPALIGAAGAIASSNFAAAVIGAGFSTYAAWSAAPTLDDYERHQDLWRQLGAMPSDDVWGSAAPDELGAWEDPDGGHGHELFHSH